MKTARWAMIALGVLVGVLVVVLAVIVPGLQVTIVVLGGGLAGWGTYGLLTEP